MYRSKYEQAMKSIRLSAMDRNVAVRDLYNYNTGSILSSKEETQESVESKQIRELRVFFFQHQPENYKRYVLGIQTHQEQCFQRGSIDFNKLWFADYLKTCAEEKDSDAVAKVAFFVRLIRRTDIVNRQFIDSKIDDYWRNDGGRATHLVTQVDYGVEFICSMRKSIDAALCESKERAEENIYLTVKAYLEQAIETQLILAEPPMELDNVDCQIFSNINTDQLNNIDSFQQLHTWLKDTLIPVGTDDENSCFKWRPVEMILSYLLRGNINSQLQLEIKNDIAYLRKRLEDTWKWIINESYKLSTHPCVNRVPTFKEAMDRSQKLLPFFWKKVKLRMQTTSLFEENCTLEQVTGSTKHIEELLTGLIDWMIRRRREIELVYFLLKNPAKNMPVLDLAEIKSRLSKESMSNVKVFVLKIQFHPDLLMDNIQKDVNKDSESIDSHAFPVFSIVSSGKECLEEVNRMLREFSDEHLESQKNPQNDCSYQIGLATEQKFKDGQIVKYSSNKPAAPPRKPGLQNVIKKDLLHKKEIGTGLKTSITISSAGSQRVESMPTLLEKNDEYKKLVEPSNCKQNDKVKFVTKDDKSSSLLPYNIRSDSVITDGQTSFGSKTQSLTLLIHQTKNDKQIDREKSRLNQRIAMTFLQNNCQSSKLVKIGYPTVHELKTLIRSNSQFNPDLRWFDIGGTNGSLSGIRNHKVIILMGATGSGKSTLIEGMINYILGVQWEDSFRFKCIREDVSESKNETHSQTSSVTAYTIHHQEGMTIPFSITIIDTPGYGDTRGIARDKEITKTIHQFLTQEDALIDKIHAACFVAASGDSRLTITQRYILDSVLSIFGKDVKESIRLMVTFADNAVPPVVEACRVANFPVTSQSVGITYSKFNSSVLYASNQGEDKFSFDRLFWDMGQENFQEFFNMLEGMVGRDLTLTREVIQDRQLLEQSMKSIERELETCLVKIENLEENIRAEYIENYLKMTNEQDVAKCSKELEEAKAKVLKLLCEVGERVRSLKSTAIRSNALSPAEYLSLMRARTAEEQKPGYLTRLQTLGELERSLVISNEGSKSHCHGTLTLH